MSRRVEVATGDGDRTLAEVGCPLDLEALAPGSGAWEVELGFGKGRYLLRQACSSPQHRFLGVEMARKYWRLLRDRARRRGLRNLVLLRGEAAELLATALPGGFASALHVYFPDPWPKARHQRRRLFDPESVDLVLGVLRPGGRLFFATDHLEYGASVAELLESTPGVVVQRRSAPWADGARTNYEAKYLAEGRPIVRLEASLDAPVAMHPAGRRGLVVGYRQRVETEAKGAP